MEACAVADAVDAFAGWHPAVTEMVGATEVGARWALHDLAPLERWHTDRVVLMGDAAHAMVPHQGQGANQTIEDAIAARDLLAGARTRVPPALPAYEAAAASARPRSSGGRGRRRPDAPPGRPGGAPRRADAACRRGPRVDRRVGQLARRQQIAELAVKHTADPGGPDSWLAACGHLSVHCLQPTDPLGVGLLRGDAGG